MAQTPAFAAVPPPSAPPKPPATVQLQWFDSQQVPIEVRGSYRAEWDWEATSPPRPPYVPRMTVWVEIPKGVRPRDPRSFPREPGEAPLTPGPRGHIRVLRTSKPISSHQFVKEGTTPEEPLGLIVRMAPERTVLLVHPGCAEAGLTVEGQPTSAKPAFLAVVCETRADSLLVHHYVSEDGRLPDSGPGPSGRETDPDWRVWEFPLGSPREHTLTVEGKGDGQSTHYRFFLRGLPAPAADPVLWPSLGLALSTAGRVSPEGAASQASFGTRAQVHATLPLGENWDTHLRFGTDVFQFFPHPRFPAENPLIEMDWGFGWDTRAGRFTTGFHGYSVQARNPEAGPSALGPYGQWVLPTGISGIPATDFRFRAGLLTRRPGELLQGAALVEAELRYRIPSRQYGPLHFLVSVSYRGAPVAGNPNAELTLIQIGLMRVL